MVRVIIFFFSIFIGAVFPAERGLWIVRNSIATQKDLAQLEQIIQSFELTDIYWQVHALGQNIIPESRDAQAINLNDVLGLCQHYGIRFHAWINAFYVWNKDWPIQKTEHSIVWDSHHIMTDPSGIITTKNILRKKGIEGYFVDPAARKNLNQIKELVKDLLLHYPVAGIHFDYFRYPPLPLHFSDFLRTKFMRYYFLDPAKFQQNAQTYFKHFGADSYRLLTRRYNLFLQRELTNQLRDLTRFAKNLKSSILVSVAVKPDGKVAKQIYGQDWPRWLNEDICDYVVEMNYTENPKIFKKNLNRAKLIKKDAQIVMGIGAYYLQRSQIIERIQEIERLGFRGYCLFSFTTFKNNPKLIRGISADSL